MVIHPFTGHTLEQPASRMLDENMVRAEPFMLPVEICRMNSGTSILTGHNFMQAQQ